MSDDDRDQDIDIESDDDDDLEASGNSFSTQAEKRAHHNALERKRRDHIKESFHGLRDSVPALHGEKASRAQILKQATDYIHFMSKKNSSIQHNIDDIKRQNNILEQQVRALEKAKVTGTFISQSSVMENSVTTTTLDSERYASSRSDTDDEDDEEDRKPSPRSKRKRLKMSL